MRGGSGSGSDSGGEELELWSMGSLLLFCTAWNGEMNQRDMNMNG